MAFSSNGQGQPFISERDILRTLAQGYTKQQVTSVFASKEQNIDGKQTLRDQTAKVLKVWQSFVKFISSQVVNNNRCVDT